MLRTFEPVVLFSGVAANGWSKSFNAKDYLYLTIRISTSNSAQGVIKVAGSDLEASDVDFTTAAAVGNEWDFIALYNENNPSAIIPGDTGVVYAGTDAVEYIYVNTGTRYTMAVQLSGWAAGAFHVTITGVTNQ